MLQRFTSFANGRGRQQLKSGRIQTDIMVAGVWHRSGTCRCGRVIKSTEARFQAIAVEPRYTVILSGGRPVHYKKSRVGWVYSPILGQLIDEVISVGK